MARATPAAARRSSAWSLSALPCHNTRGAGRPLAAGAMRLPRPALNSIAAFSVTAIPAILASASPQQGLAPHIGREVPVVPRPEACEGRRPQGAGKISPSARHMLQILRLAVPLEKSRPESQKARVALGPEVGIGRRKGRPV